jgi:hypothetical protein
VNTGDRAQSEIEAPPQIGYVALAAKHLFAPFFEWLDALSS